MEPNQCSWDGLIQGQDVPPKNINKEAISRLFYFSLALSVGKKTQAGDIHYARVNPSSGNLHPIEAYVIAGSIDGVCDSPAIYHYNSYDHALEKRLSLASEQWATLAKDLPEGGFFIGVTSIHWRQVWKYGIRGYRYALLDVGHALGGLALAAGCEGWCTRIVPELADSDLSKLLGANQDTSIEREYPQTLLAVVPEFADKLGLGVSSAITALAQESKPSDFYGNANTISSEHHAWPILEKVGEAVENTGEAVTAARLGERSVALSPDRKLLAHKIIRQRRSPHVMDPESRLPRETFYRILANALPEQDNPLFALQPWQSHVSVALYVHRVDDLSPGLYVLARTPQHEASLRKAFADEAYEWKRPKACPEGLSLFLLKEGDYQQHEELTCGQDIVRDGIFGISMLADLKHALSEDGPSIYPRLYWEAGLVGHLFCIEGEAAGLHARGIGCFMDDATHEKALGLKEQSWQSLYHQTFGGGHFSFKLDFVETYAHRKT